MSVKTPCTDHLGNKYKSFNEMCKAYNMQAHTVEQRLSKGFLLEDALTARMHTRWMGEDVLSFVKESHRGDFVFYTYEMKKTKAFSRVYNPLLWLSGLIYHNIISTRLVTLRNSGREIDEEDESVYIKIPLAENGITMIDITRMNREIKDKNLDIISVDGKFEQEPISIVCNLRTNMIAIGFDSEHVVDRHRLECKLRLWR